MTTADNKQEKTFGNSLQNFGEGDFLSVNEKGGQQDIPTADECDVILCAVFGVPERVRRHGRKVAQVAERIGRALVTTGMDLNLDRITAGALLHDLAKGVKDHAIVGQRVLDQMGFGDIAHIVGAHTDLELAANPVITETEVVHLADKLIKEDRMVTIEEKFQWPLDRWGHDPVALARINRRRDVAYRLKDSIEAILGFGLEELLGDLTDTAGSGI